MRRCSECGRDIDGRRDRVTCSDQCRVARSRRLERPQLTTSTYNGPDGRMAGIEQRCECGASWRKTRGPDFLNTSQVRTILESVLLGRRFGNGLSTDVIDEVMDRLTNR